MWREIPTEFEVQAAAYELLKKAGYIVRGEIAIKNPKGRGARFDLVVYNDRHTPVLTIEVKGPPTSRPHTKKAHYEMLAQCPNIQVSGMKEAQGIVERVKKLVFF